MHNSEVSNRRILLVDDDTDDQLYFMDALSEINTTIQCEIASNGQEALDFLERQHMPDLIFLDLNMPVMNGFDCLIELRKKERFNHVPVIIFTTTSDLVTIKRTHELGADAFFKKPNDLSTMLTKLQALLESDFTIRNSQTAFSFAAYSL